MNKAGWLPFALLIGAAAPALAQPAKFDPAKFTTVQITVDGQPMTVRRYAAVYVGKPIEAELTRPPRLGGPPGGAPGAGGPPAAPPGAPQAGPAGAAAPSDPHAYQSLYVYVPEASLNDPSKAIVMQVGNAGWVASAAQDVVREGGTFSSTSNTDATGAALKAGYIVVNVGTRSRNLRAVGGDWAGKAPAVVVDAKAAIRYLRANDAVMPGSAERIVITGTSGGGGLSVAVSASGDSPDYYPYLAAIGAAGFDARGRSTLRDNVFATIAYCPINDLGNADLAYEWQYNAVRTTENTAPGRYTPAAQAASATLAARYPAFLDGLRLKREDGSALTALTLPSAIVALVRTSVEGAIARGDKIPALGEDFEITRRGPPGTPAATVKVKNTWLTVEGGQVRNIDYPAYLAFVAGNQALKTVPAFDATASTGATTVAGENTLFGSAKADYINFTPYAWNNNTVRGDGSGPDDAGQDWNAYIAGPGAELARQIKLTSPLPYLRSATATAAPYWYVRHGLLDRDTSFATQATLNAAIKNDPSVKGVDFKIAWMQGHAGNYDVQEAYGWLARVLKDAGNPAAPAR